MLYFILSVNIIITKTMKRFNNNRNNRHGNKHKSNHLITFERNCNCVKSNHEINKQFHDNCVKEILLKIKLVV